MLLKLQLFGRNGAALAPVYCCKMPHNIQLISFIIVILNPIIDFVFYFSEISALGNIEYYGSNVPLFRRNGYRQSGTMIP